MKALFKRLVKLFFGSSHIIATKFELVARSVWGSQALPRPQRIPTKIQGMRASNWKINHKTFCMRRFVFQKLLWHSLDREKDRQIYDSMLSPDWASVFLEPLAWGTRILSISEARWACSMATKTHEIQHWQTWKGPQFLVTKILQMLNKTVECN